MRNFNYKNLRFYELGRELVIIIYSITKKFPDDEQGFTGIVNQLKRASISVVSNIAEGSSRKDKELLYFLTLSLGSLREIETQLSISKDLNFIENYKFTEIEEKIDECIAKLCVYMKRINEKLKENK